MLRLNFLLSTISVCLMLINCKSNDIDLNSIPFKWSDIDSGAICFVQEILIGIFKEKKLTEECSSIIISDKYYEKPKGYLVVEMHAKQSCLSGTLF